MFDDLIQKETVEETILIEKSVYDEMKKNIKEKQEIISRLVDDIVDLKFRISEIKGEKHG